MTNQNKTKHLSDILKPIALSTDCGRSSCRHCGARRQSSVPHSIFSMEHGDNHQHHTASSSATIPVLQGAPYLLLNNECGVGIRWRNASCTSERSWVQVPAPCALVWWCNLSSWGLRRQDQRIQGHTEEMAQWVKHLLHK